VNHNQRNVNPWTAILLFVILAALIWLPRGMSLDRFVTSDEVPWLWRSANFYYALGQRDFAATYLNRSPGVITMWVETAAMLLEFPEYRGFGQGNFDKYTQYESFLISNSVDPHDILVTSRKIMVILNSLLILGAFLLARQLFGSFPILVGFCLIAFDPFHIAITRLSHLDGPLSSFLFLSVLALLVYSFNQRRLLYLIVSASAAGLAILAKIPALIMLPYVATIMLLTFIKTPQDEQPVRTKFTNKLLGELIKPLVLWGLIFLLTILIFFPAMWESPLEGIARLGISPFTTSRVKLEAISPDEEDSAEDSIIQSFLPQRSLKYYIRYPKGYLWRVTPIVLIGLLAALAATIFRMSIFANPKIRISVLGLLFFVLLYTVIMTIPPKSSYKYYAPVYPIMDLIAGLGWFAFVDWIRKLRILGGRKYFTALILIPVILFQAYSSLRTSPYYFSYYNPLLGGSHKAGTALFIGSGEGLNLAAEYLNRKPNAEELMVLSWYGIGPFSYYFTGQTKVLSLGDSVWSEELAAELKEFDYLVIYANQWRRKLPEGLFPRIKKAQPEKTIWINGIEYARIYEVKNLPKKVFKGIPWPPPQ